MERINYFFLHGFLGRPEDWSAVVTQLPKNDRVRYFTPDFFNTVGMGPQCSFQDWATSFNSWVKTCVASGDQNILVGYSLGGRLALHAFKKQPILWSKVILISTNPGMSDNDSAVASSALLREQRLENDAHWASKFLHGSWDEVLKEWNSQGVFSGSVSEPVRFEKNYDRSLLAAALMNWSLARQQDMIPLLKVFADKVLWVVGEQDKKYYELSRGLIQEIPELRVRVISEAGHRVLFDNPASLRTLLLEFL